MEVTSLGDALQVQFERLPVTAVVKVTVWRRGHEQQVRPSFPLFQVHMFCLYSFVFHRFLFPSLYVFVFHLSFIYFHFSSLFWIEKCGFTCQRGSESSFHSASSSAGRLHHAGRADGAARRRPSGRSRVLRQSADGPRQSALQSQH